MPKEKLRPEVEKEFSRILGWAPEGAVQYALGQLNEGSSSDVREAVHRTLVAALDCLQTVVRAAKSS